MASIYQRYTVWWVLYYQHGRRVRKAISRSKKEALAFKREVEYKQSKGQMEISAPSIALATAKDDFLKKISVYVRSKTIQNYRIVLNKFISWLSDNDIVALNEITQGAIGNYISDRKEEKSKKGGKIQSSTLSLELKAIKYFFKTCVGLGYLKTNPAQEIKPIKPPKTLPYYFSEDDLNKIFQSEETPYYKRLYIFLLLSGMRVGELCNLCHEDIDLERRHIFIKEKTDWKPKTGERVIPISEELAQVISSVPKSGSRYLFVNERGKKLTVHGLDVRFIRLRRSLGLEKGTPHTFRHTFASYLTMRTGNIRAIQMILGHQKLETTQIYSHLSDEYLRSVANEMNLGIATVLATVEKKKALRKAVNG